MPTALGMDASTTMCFTRKKPGPAYSQSRRSACAPPSGGRRHQISGRAHHEQNRRDRRRRSDSLRRFYRDIAAADTMTSGGLAATRDQFAIARLFGGHRCEVRSGSLEQMLRK